MYSIIINNDLTATVGITDVPFKFEYDSTSGKYGYRDGADTFCPFNDGSGGSDYKFKVGDVTLSSSSKTKVTLGWRPDEVLICSKSQPFTNASSAGNSMSCDLSTIGDTGKVIRASVTDTAGGTAIYTLPSSIDGTLASIDNDGFTINKVTNTSTSTRKYCRYIAYSYNGFNPSKMELTQEEFIRICNEGLQSMMSIGAIIHVNNEYCNTLEVIDVNHEGTLNTVDVMAHTQVGNMVFGTSNNYNTSSIRTWINNDYINAFDSSIQSLMKTMQVTTMGTTQNDKAKLLSWREIGLTNYNMDNTDGGVQYPVFTAGTYDSGILNRWRDMGIYGNASYYWTRSRASSDPGYVWKVYSSGTCGGGNCTAVSGVLSVLRF